MCLITTQKKPLIAEEDMTVYKILTDDLHSPYNIFKYEKEELYQTEIEDNDEWCCFDSIDENYLNNNYPTWQSGSEEELFCKGPGFHSALSLERLANTKSSFEIIFTCTIPKGSEYFTEPTGLCVSNQIIIH